MARILILYYSKTGHTKAMAEAVSEGVLEVGGVVPEVRSVEESGIDNLLEPEGILIGSPTYYGGMAWPVKRLLDESVRHHGKLQGKVGGAFSSAGGIGGGNETTVLGILQALLIHGMVVQGTPSGDHYGAVAVEEPDERSRRNCRDLGRRTAELVSQLFG
jgi:NAD(P)H dehydrogenase (quinone)